MTKVTNYAKLELVIRISQVYLNAITDSYRILARLDRGGYVIMYAIISCGGKQYKVQVDDVIDVERMDNNAGDKLTFSPLLISADGKVSVGTPTVKGATVEATVVEHGKGDKLQIAVYKKMNGHHRAQGHRQPFTRIKITSIKA